MLSFLTARFLAYTGGFVALILAGLLTVQTVKLHWANERIGKLEDRVATVEKDRDTWKANADELDVKLKVQNAAVDALRQETEARAAEIAKARQATRQEAQRADHAIILLSQAQPKGADACARTADAVRIAREAVR